MNLVKLLVSSWLFVALFQACRGSNAEQRYGTSNLIVSGSNPYQVAILRRVEFNFDVIGGQRFVCSGTLIDQQWVLTAAQCVTEPKLRVVLGASNIRASEPDQQHYDIDKYDVIIHPNFNPDDLENDIALIKLPYPAEFSQNVQPIVLDAEPGDHVNQTAFLSGWGRVSVFTPVADYLRQTSLKVIPNEACQRQLLKPFFYVRCLNLCTEGGLLYSEIGACAADPGAPLVTYDANTLRPEVIGIVSKLPFICKGTEPTLYTKVSQYADWIEQTVTSSDRIYTVCGAAKTKTPASEVDSDNEPACDEDSDNESASEEDSDNE